MLKRGASHHTREHLRALAGGQRDERRHTWRRSRPDNHVCPATDYGHADRHHHERRVGGEPATDPAAEAGALPGGGNLERQNLGFSRDVSSALLPGTLGPVGPLAVTDIVAHNANPDSAARFDQTMAAATSGLAGTILLTSGLDGYLRALVDDSSESNFTEIVQPSPPPFVFPSASADTNLPVAGTFRALLVNESQAVGVAQTLLYSLRRARGAAAANNALAQAQQLRAAGLAAAQLATLLSREPLTGSTFRGR